MSSFFIVSRSPFPDWIALSIVIDSPSKCYGINGTGSLFRGFPGQSGILPGQKEAAPAVLPSARKNFAKFAKKV
jgi:hypothetical protein